MPYIRVWKSPERKEVFKLLHYWNPAAGDSVTTSIQTLCAVTFIVNAGDILEDKSSGADITIRKDELVEGAILYQRSKLHLRELQPQAVRHGFNW